MSRLLVPQEIRTQWLSESIEHLRLVAGPVEGEEVLCHNPVFVLTSGWRTGSTLLQRLICSDDSILVWGEPYGDSLPVPKLASTLENFGPDSPYMRYITDALPGELTEEWIANLYPGLQALRSAHLAYFELLFAGEARRLGFPRWGVKWVRLTADHAHYLQWLYPEAQFIFLVRHPLAAYQSYKGQRWYTIKPHHPVSNVFRFMAHWGCLTQTFLDNTKVAGTTDSMLVRYEDLIGEGQAVVRQIGDFLNLSIQTKVLDTKVGTKKHKRTLYPWDYLACQLLAGKACRRLGYRVSHRPASRVEMPAKGLSITHPSRS